MVCPPEANAGCNIQPLIILNTQRFTHILRFIYFYGVVNLTGLFHAAFIHFVNGLRPNLPDHPSCALYSMFLLDKNKSVMLYSTRLACVCTMYNTCKLPKCYNFYSSNKYFGFKEWCVQQPGGDGDCCSEPCLAGHPGAAPATSSLWLQTYTHTPWLQPSGAGVQSSTWSTHQECGLCISPHHNETWRLWLKPTITKWTVSAHSIYGWAWHFSHPSSESSWGTHQVSCRPTAASQDCGWS